MIKDDVKGIKMKITNKTNKKLKKGDVEIIKAKAGEGHSDKFHTDCYLIYVPTFVKEIILK